MARSLYNYLRMQEDDKALQALQIGQLNEFYKVVQAKIAYLNQVEASQDSQLSENIAKLALESIYFEFVKIGEAQLHIADEVENQIRKTRESFARNADTQDPKYLSLLEELQRIFKNRNINPHTQTAMEEDLREFKRLEQEVNKLNQENRKLSEKYLGDNKYMRLHKRLRENRFGYSEIQLFTGLSQVKSSVDEIVFNNETSLENEAMFQRQVRGKVFEAFPEIPVDDMLAIQQLVAKAYVEELR